MTAPQPQVRGFRFHEVIGQGGFGTVYRAERLGEGGFTKQVAVKVLSHTLPEGGEEIARRFRDEARVLGIVRHRAIVQVDSLLQLEGSWAVVMELGPGMGHPIRVRGCDTWARRLTRRSRAPWVLIAAAGSGGQEVGFASSRASLIRMARG